MKNASVLLFWQKTKVFVKKVLPFRLAVHDAYLAPLLALFFLFIIYRRLLMGRVIATGDLETYFYPYWVAVSRSLRSGTLPFWNPYLFAGVPLLANSQVGLFYPVNWPLWLIAGDTLQSVTAVLHASLLLHIALALLSVYYLGRKLGLSPWASALSGLVYSGSGFIGIHVEHLNQLQALSWMPLIFLPGTIHDKKHLPHPISLAAMAMILLAGHTQMAFITAVALILWQTFKLLSTSMLSIDKTTGVMKGVVKFSQLPSTAIPWLYYFIPYGIAGLIAAVQLLPTLELVKYSARQAGLYWQEAVSFSLEPWKIASTLLPPYIGAPNFPESVAYIGSLALCLVGCCLWIIVRKRRFQYLPVVLMSLAGLMLALGGYNPLYLLGVRIGLPGLKHFRAPVRFLAMYSLFISLLAGLGLDFVHEKAKQFTPSGRLSYPRVLNFAIFLMTCAELILCAEWLPHADATIPRSYTNLRPSTAQLISLTNESKKKGSVPGRFISISQMLFEIGDKQEIESIYAKLVSTEALWSYFVSAKQREVLTPNLPLAFQILAADGYDGGLLPMAEYIAFSHLLVEGGTVDGRLRENIVTIPDKRWLNLMDVRYVITDKVSDTWVDDILYDRQFIPVLAGGEDLTLAWLPDTYKADGIGLIYKGQGGEVTVKLSDGNTLRFVLPDMADDKPYRIKWDQASSVSSIRLSTRQNVTYKGISLINDTTGSFYPLVLSDSYKLVHSGDVKIYEDTKPYGHAFFVTECQAAESDAQVLAILSDPAFDPQLSVVLANEDTIPCYSTEDEINAKPALSNAYVQVLEYGESSLELEVNTDKPGFVVVSDAWYPGWHAQLSKPNETNPSRTIPVMRGNLMFRAIPVPAGHWYITMTYQSKHILFGAILAGIGLVLLFFYNRYIRTRKNTV